MTPQEIIDRLEGSNIILSQKNDEYIELSKKRAEAERIYNVAVAEETLRLKLEGTAATIMDKLVKGNKTVAQFKFDLDVADGVLKACSSQIKIILAQIDTYRSLLAWMKMELHNAR